MRHFVPITKVDAVKREVWGTAAEEAPDKSGEVMDYAASKPLFEEWSAGIAKTTDGKSLGNVRSMHGDVAAGKVINLQFDDVEKKVMVGAKIVDDNEWKKVEEGVYTGFSVGGKYGWRKPDPKLGKMRYQAVPVEISLVDNPCMYGATFSVVKADGAQDLAKFVGGEATPEELAKLSNEEANAAYEAKWSIQDASGLISALSSMVNSELQGDNAPAAQQLLTALRQVQSFANGKVSELEAIVNSAGAPAGDPPPAAGMTTEVETEVEEPEEDSALAAAAKADKLRKAVLADVDARIAALPKAEPVNVLDGVVTALADPQVVSLVKTLITSQIETLLANPDQPLNKAAADASQQLSKLAGLEAGFGALEKRVAAVEARPVVAGPVLREVGAGAGGVDDVAVQIAALQKTASDATDPVFRQSLQRQIADLQMKQVYAAGGNRIA
jgi:hypothetical protein